MLPNGYVGLVVADTRRALEWEVGLRNAGYDVVRVETSGADADKGGWQIGVARRDASRAQAFVAEVLRGDAVLPRQPFLSRSGWLALLAIGAILAAILIAGIATR